VVMHNNHGLLEYYFYLLDCSKINNSEHKTQTQLCAYEFYVDRYVCVCFNGYTKLYKSDRHSMHNCLIVYTLFGLCKEVLEFWKILLPHVLVNEKGAEFLKINSKSINMGMIQFVLCEFVLPSTNRIDFA
jgi:hypothetical protein